MNGTMRQITVYRFGQFGQIERIEGELVTLDGLAARTGLHPTLIERFVEYGLIEPVERAGAHMLFDVDCVARVRKIERLRRHLGANLASVAVILDLLDRLSKLEKEIERLRGLAL
jgi:DNA-binding transcriptional MerR regulator